jgi:hypothetical protein
MIMIVGISFIGISFLLISGLSSVAHFLQWVALLLRYLNELHALLLSNSLTMFEDSPEFKFRKANHFSPTKVRSNLGSRVHASQEWSRLLSQKFMLPCQSTCLERIALELCCTFLETWYVQWFSTSWHWQLSPSQLPSWITTKQLDPLGQLSSGRVGFAIGFARASFLQAGGAWRMKLVMEIYQNANGLTT